MHSRIPLMTNRDVFSGSSNVSTPLSHGDDRKREREEPDDLGLFTWRALSEWCLCQTLASVAAGGRVGVPRHVPPRDRSEAMIPSAWACYAATGASSSRARGSTFIQGPSAERRAATSLHADDAPGPVLTSRAYQV